MMSVAIAPSAKKIGTPQPNRRCNRIVSGLIDTTTMYTPRNHSGPNGNVAPGGDTPRNKRALAHSLGPVGRTEFGGGSPNRVTDPLPRTTAESLGHTCR